MKTQETKYMALLNAFPTIDLENMDKVKLMDRKDTKFIFREELMETILLPLKDEYHVLWVKGCNCCPYESIYYDTQDFNLYFDHHKGKLNRFKIRHRKYIGSETMFFEIKFKTNKDRTIKHRIKVPVQNQGIGSVEESFLEGEMNIPKGSLHPSLQISFNRTTLVNLRSPERVTLDTNLRFQYKNKFFCLDGIVIAEAKQDRATKSAFVTQMKNLHIRNGSLSKYCMGLSLLVDELKSNNFKPKIKQLKKLMHDHLTGSE